MNTLSVSRRQVTDAIAWIRRSSQGTNWSVFAERAIRAWADAPSIHSLTMCAADVCTMRAWLDQQRSVLPPGADQAAQPPDHVVICLEETQDSGTGIAQATAGASVTGIQHWLFQAQQMSDDASGWPSLLAFVELSAGRWARRYHVDFDDLAQEAALQLWRRRTQDLPVANWEAFATRVMQRIAGHMRQETARIAVDSDLIAQSPQTEATERHVDRDELLALPMKAGERCIVELLVAGCSVRAIARHTGRTPYRVRSTLSGLVRRLTQPLVAGGRRGSPDK